LVEAVLLYNNINNKNIINKDSKMDQPLLPAIVNGEPSMSDIARELRSRNPSLPVWNPAGIKQATGRVYMSREKG
jgi:hypothetical protein